MKKIPKLSITKYLGLEQQSPKIQSIFTRFILMTMLENVVKGITSSFFILYIINDQGFERASIITSILLIVKLITDYPSGSLSDYIGQSKVLALSYGFYSVAISILVFADNFFTFAIVAVFLGLADAQSSGTIFSWLDNNYKNLVENSDPENRIYAYAKTRSRTLYRTVLGLVVMIGGSLSTHFSRIFVFKIEATLSLIAILLSLLLLKNSKNNSTKFTNDGFVDHLKGGISFIFLSKKNFALILGSSIYDAGWVIWISIILFPFYFGYTGSDQVSTLLRSVIFFSGTIVVLLASNLSRSYKKEQLAIAQFIQIIIMIGGVLILLLIIPMKNEWNIIATVAIIIVFNISSLVSVVVNSLESRLYVNLIPSKYRNSVYSLIPTLTAFVAITVLPLTGKLIQEKGLISGLWIVIALCMIGTLMLHWSIYLLDHRKTNVEQARVTTIATV